MECTNNTGLYNLQPAACIVTPSITQKFIFVQYFKSDGTINGLDLTTPLTNVAVDALIAQSNKLLRWYPTAEISNFVTDRADPNTESIDNIEYVISQGARTMSGDFLTASTELANKINDNNQTVVGIYLIDDENGLTGIVNRDNYLDPIKLERNAFGKIVFSTETNVFKVSYSSTWGKNVKDGDVRTLTFDDHATDFLSKKGLVDVKNRNSATTATTATVELYITNGDAQGIDFEGLVIGDFVMTNVTTSAVVTPSAVVELSPGKYEFTYIAQTTSDVGTIVGTKAGFEFATVNFIFA